MQGLTPNSEHDYQLSPKVANSHGISVAHIRARHKEVSECNLRCVLTAEGKKKYRHKGVFYPDLIPPNWDQSKKHERAWLVGKQVPIQENREYELCPCCYMQVDKQMIDINAEVLELSFLGSGYPLFFNFIRYSVIIIGIVFLTSGQFSLISNLLGVDCSTYEYQVQKRYGDIQNKQKHLNNVFHKTNEHHTFVLIKQIENYCENDFISQASIANNRFYWNENLIGDWMTLTSTLVLIISIFIFRRSQLLIDTECDVRENTPPDYTIMCTNIPQIEKPKEYLYDLFENYFNSGAFELQERIKVSHVNLVYFMEDVDKLTRKRLRQIEKKKIALQKLEYDSDEYFQVMWDFDQKIFRKQKEIQTEARVVSNNPKKFSGVAFVSFETENQKQEILKLASLSTQKFVCNCMLGCFLQQDKEVTRDDISIQVVQAPEPSDIIWENIVHNTKLRLSKRIMGFLFSKIVIFTFIFVLMLTARLQAAYQNELNEKQKKVYDSATGQVTYDQTVSNSHHLFAFGCSLFTVFINSFVVEQITRFLVRYEAYETFSQYDVSLAQKLSLTLFINSALIAYFTATIYTQNFYGPGGLIYIETYFFFSNAFAQPLIHFVDSDRIEKALYKWWYRRQGPNCVLTQQEANQLYENPEHQIEIRYADLMKTLFLTFFYANLLPIGYIISFFGLIIYYWVEKYVLLTRQTVKHTPSVKLSLLMTEMLEYIPMMYAFANLLFKYQISGYFSLISIVATIISLIHIIVPVQQIVEKYFSPPTQIKDETKTYSQAEPDFKQNYETENPVSRQIIDRKIFDSRSNSLSEDAAGIKYMLHLSFNSELPEDKGDIDVPEQDQAIFSKFSQKSKTSPRSYQKTPKDGEG